VYGLALDKDGALLAADWKAGKVYRIAKGKKKLVAEGLSYPSGLVCTGTGDIYVKESGRQTGKDMTIRRIAPDGKVTLFATVPSRSRFD
jgi:sugar lactone lactonase YvrE